MSWAGATTAAAPPSVLGAPEWGDAPPASTATSGEDGPAAVALLTTWAGLATGLLLLCTALGNTLVFIAIAWDKRLHNMTNYFLMSLAATDFMVALLVMPFGILVIVKGSFPFSRASCVAWITLDVLFCTSSILHLCTLSVDRYLSLSHPIKYGRNKTRRRVLLKIAVVWLTSAALSVPLCLMYARDEEGGEDGGGATNRQVLRAGVCAIQDPLYMVLGSVVSFFIPLVIMIVTHVLTMRLLRRAERSKSFALYSATAVSGGGGGKGAAAEEAGERRASSLAPPPLSANAEDGQPQRRPSTHSWKRLLSKTYSNVSASTTTDADCSSESPGGAVEMQRLGISGGGGGRHPSDDDDRRNPLSGSAEEVWLEVNLDAPGGAASVMRRSASHPLLLLLEPAATAAGADPRRGVSVGGGGSGGNGTAPRRSSCSVRRCFAARQGGRYLQSERKATKVLGVIFATFVVLWAPFFLLNVALGLCPECAGDVSPALANVVLWLGYASSTVNPIFYTVFNPTFRQTFGRILTCQFGACSSANAVNSAAYT